MFALVGALVLGGVLASGLELLGFRLRHRLGDTLGVADGLGGAALVACLGLALVWVAGAVALHTPGATGLREPIQRSSVLTRLNEALPPSGPLLQALARFDPFPDITGPDPGVSAPDSAIARDPEVRAAGRSVVRVLGTACGLGVQGSGWVAGDGVVVTNAHVVAGQDDTTVQLGGQGQRFDAQAIHFDVRNDVAVLRVPGVSGVRALTLNEQAPQGTGAAVLGYPENGPYDVEPARVGRTRTVLSQDAYGRGPVQRKITALRGLVRSGNSGGPAVGRRRPGGGHDLRRGARVGQRQRLRGAGFDRAGRSGAKQRTGVHRALLPLSFRASAMNWPVQYRLFLALAGVFAVAVVVAPTASAQKPANPCLDPVQRAQLRCPDLIMRRPFGLRVDPFVHPGRVMLRAGNSIDSVGAGPAELFGVRSSRMYMKARQRIYRRARGQRFSLATGARLYFKYVPRQRSYWKFLHAAQFDLYRLEVERHPRQARAPRSEGQLLPARPRTHPAGQGAVAQRARVPGLQHQLAHAQGAAGHLGGLVGRVPARLPRAVPRRDRPARLLRLRAHRRSPQRHLRVQRDQQLVDGGGPAAVQGRPPALPRTAGGEDAGYAELRR